MSERKRSTEYRDLLNQIYGQTVVDAFVESSADEPLKKFGPDKLNDFIQTRNTQDGNKWADKEGCQKCRELCNNFSERKMDFPSWLGELDFSKENAKKIMLIGEDVGPSVKAYINIAYGLGRYEIDMETGVMGAEKRNLLWMILKKIFPENIGSKTGLEWITDNIYITDICKCGATELAENQQQAKAKKERDKFWGECSKKYLIDEIKLVRPKVIIFQGNPSYNYVTNLAKKREDISLHIDDLANGDIISEGSTFPRYGHIKLGDIDDMKINFLKIYHSSNTNNYSWTPQNICLFKRLVGEKVMNILDT